MSDRTAGARAQRRAARPSPVGRAFRTLRLACGLSQAEPAIAIVAKLTRIKELEAARAGLGYLEGPPARQGASALPAVLLPRLRSRARTGGT